MIVANIASYPARSDILPTVLDAIHMQVDVVNLVLNEYIHIPDWIQKYKNVVATIPKIDLKDTGKFLPEFHHEDMVLLMDDDIGYPPDYVTSSIWRWEKLANERAIAGYHASTYKRPTACFLQEAGITLDVFRDKIFQYRDVLFFAFALDQNQSVDQLGSGTLVARGSSLPPFSYMHNAQRFVDVRLARWAFEQRIQMISLPRNDSWIKPLKTSETIFETFTVNSPEYVSREILSFVLPEAPQ